jgi:hypothetical protein
VGGAVAVDLVVDVALELEKEIVCGRYRVVGQV